MTAFALALPSDGRPRGSRFQYSTATSHLLSPILKNAYGIDTFELATRNLFQPLGIAQPRGPGMKAADSRLHNGVGQYREYGHGGQHALLVPSLNLVIATAAELNVDYATAGTPQRMLVDLIARFLQAVKG